MTSIHARRSVLRVIGAALSAGLAGCNVVGRENGLDVEIRNEHAESHEVSVAIDDFEETATLDPDTSETFADVLPYPGGSTEVEATVSIDEDWEDTETFSLGEGLNAFIVNIGPDEEYSYTFKGR